MSIDGANEIQRPGVETRLTGREDDPRVAQNVPDRIHTYADDNAPATGSRRR
jgi:hypothetical protein